MAVPRPTYKESLRLAADSGDREYALMMFCSVRRVVLDWQQRQFDSWRAGEQRPLERWMREYIASQWTEFLEAVEWSLPFLAAIVAEKQRELQQRQTERAVAIRRVQRARGLPLASCGPVIAALGRDIEIDADEGPRSVLETMQLVYRYTHEEGPPEWLDGVCVQREKRLKMTAPLEWKRSCEDNDTCDSDNPMCEGEGGTPVDDSEETWSETSTIVYGNEARSRYDLALLEDMQDSDADVHAEGDSECGSPTYSEVPDDFEFPAEFLASCALKSHALADDVDGDDVAPRHSLWNCGSPVYSPISEDDEVSGLGKAEPEQHTFCA